MGNEGYRCPSIIEYMYEILKENLKGKISLAGKLFPYPEILMFKP